MPPEPSTTSADARRATSGRRAPAGSWRRELAWSVGVTGAAIALATLCYVPGDLSTESMILVLGAVAQAMRCRPAIAMVGVLLGGAAFNFLFTEPRLSMRIHEPQSVIAFAVMLAIGGVVAGLAQRLRAESAAVAQREAQLEVERLRSTLLASVSHDLRTPLTGITGAATALLEDDTMRPEVKRRLTQGIIDEASRLDDLINNLLFATRIESGDVSPRREWIDLGELAAAALRRAEPQLGPRRVTLIVEPGLPLLRGDPVLLEQLAFLLLDNAARHTAASCTVRISVCRRSDELALEVADDGEGIDPALKETLFARFERDKRSPGLGLGLAIASAIARAHDGTLRHVPSALGGAAFELRLAVPREQPDVPIEADAPEASP